VYIKYTMSKDTDYLSSDPEMRDQKTALISFLPPKEFHDIEFSQPIKEVLSTKVDANMEEFIANLADKAGLDTTGLNMDEFRTEMKRFIVETSSPVFIERERKWETAVKRGLMGGVKIRGVFGSEKVDVQEMNDRCELLSKTDKHFHLFKGPVGYWLPFNQPVSTVKEVQYSEKKLNDIMESFMKNKIQSEVFEKQRQQEMQEDILRKNLENSARTDVDNSESADAPQITITREDVEDDTTDANEDIENEIPTTEESESASAS